MKLETFMNISTNNSTKKNSASATGSILLVNLARGFGGVDVRVFDTARALAEADRPYSVAVLDNSPIHQKLLEAGLNASPITGSKFSPKVISALKTIIEQNESQIIDAHNVQSWLWSGFAASQTGTTKLITSVHLPSRRIPGGPKGWLEEQIIKQNWRKGSYFLTVSDEIANYLAADVGIPTSRITRSYNALHWDEIKASGQPIPLRQIAGWPDDTYIFAAIGRLTRQKGLDFLFEALSELIDQHPKIRFAIVGDGELRQQLTEQVNQFGLNNFVHFLGYRNDIPDILASVDAFCLPSRGEGLPYALLEACAFKLPILASKVDAVAELFTHNETAYLTPPGDVSALRQGIAWIMQNPQMAQSLGQRANTFVRQRLSLDIMVQETMTLYDAL